MFNKTVINQQRGTNYVPYAKTVTVNENRAPTDKSVELLNEMQEKASENLIRTIKINNSVCEAIAFLFRNNYVDNRFDWMFKVKLNNKEFMFNGYFEDDHEFKRIVINADINSNWFDADRFVNKLFHQKLSELIAAEILNQTKYQILETMFSK